MTIAPNQYVEGLNPQSWGGMVLAKESLTTAIPTTGAQPTAENGVIASDIRYPLYEDQPPVDAYIVALDFGKRALKAAGVNRLGRMQTNTTVDAYVATKWVQQDEINDKGESLWKVIGTDGKVTESFRKGAKSLRTAETLPINEALARRLADLRVRNMTIATVAEQLDEIEVVPTIMEGDIAVSKRLNVVLAIGLPVDDLSKRASETGQALTTQLKGLYTVEQFSTLTGRVTHWLIDIIAVIPVPQPRGTHYTATRKLDGTSATKKQLVTVIDIGGGDIYAYEVDSTSGVIAEAKRLGDGTISIARELIPLVEDRYGVVISEAQAQEALHTKKIMKAGDEYDITDLLTELHPRWSNLLTKINITSRMLTTFIIFTGGGAALLYEELREKMAALPGKRLESIDYLVMPRTLAPIANVVGVFAHGYYKVQREIRKAVTAYLALAQERRTLQNTIRTLSRQTGQEAAMHKKQEELQAVVQRLGRHVGKSYPTLIELIAQEQSQAVDIPAR